MIALVLCVLVLSSFYAPAQSVPVFGITAAIPRQIVKFDHLAPGQVISTVALDSTITSTILGIDYRPLTGELYALASNSALYRINTYTGASTQLYTLSGCATTDTTVQWFINFNPSADALRIINSAGVSLRVNSAGTCFTDGPIADRVASSTVTPAGAAYSQNFANTTTTSLYVLDAAGDRLGLINPANSGNFTAVGGFGGVTIDPTDVVVFDIVSLSASSNIGYVHLTKGATTTYYQVDLSSGAFTSVGTGRNLIGMALSLSPVSTTVMAITSNNQLVTFESDDAVSSFGTARSFTGGRASETFVGLDFRPANGLVYVVGRLVGSVSRIYTLNPATAALTLSANLNCSLNSTALFFGVGFNPVADRLRVVASTGENYRIDVTVGTCLIDGAINPTTSSPSIGGVAYTDSTFGTPGSTVLYAFDYTNRVYGTIAPPNNGVFNPVTLSFPASSGTNVVALEIFGSNNFGNLVQSGNLNLVWAATSLGSQSVLLKLQDGVATRFANLPAALISFAASPYGTVVVPPAFPASFITVVSNSLNVYNGAALAYTIAITGLASGDNVVDADFRPATNVLYVLGSANNLYTVSLATGAATQLPALINCSLTAAVSYSMDFNPVADRLRIVGANGDNFRINVATSGCIIDGNLFYPAEPAVPVQAISVAYSNSLSPTPTITTEYVLTLDDFVGTVFAPNGGNTTKNIRLGLDINFPAPFDIYSTSSANVPLAVVRGADNFPRLVYIDPSTQGLAGFVGIARTLAFVGTNTTVVSGFAVVPSGATVTPPTVATTVPVVPATVIPPTDAQTTNTPSTLAPTVPGGGTLAPSTIAPTSAPSSSATTIHSSVVVLVLMLCVLAAMF